MHHAIKLTQSAWLKPWIGLNTDFRKVAKNAFEKITSNINQNSLRSIFCKIRIQTEFL